MNSFNFEKYLQRIKTENDDLSDLMSDESFDKILEFPLNQGKIISGLSEHYNSFYYHWFIENILSYQNNIQFSISLYCSPDFSNFRFLPGIGITSYTYHHNGIASDCDIRL